MLNDKDGTEANEVKACSSTNSKKCDGEDSQPTTKDSAALAADNTKKEEVKPVEPVNTRKKYYPDSACFYYYGFF